MMRAPRLSALIGTIPDAEAAPSRLAPAPVAKAAPVDPAPAPPVAETAGPARADA